MIQIKWTEIKIDVDKQTWRIAKARIEDSELRSDAQEDGTKTSLTLIMRWAESGIALVTAAIREKLSFSSTSVSTDNIDMSKETWTFSLKESTTIGEEALAMLIHKFVVEYILFRWCMLWLPDEASAWQKSYTSTLSDITEAAFDLSEPSKDKRQIYDETESESVVAKYVTT